jgi:phenylacetate-coenzyme A ligase PaaK-like adenylate-forming protein
MHGFFVYDWRGWIEMGLSSARVVSQMGVVPGVDERLASLAALNPSHGSAAFTQSFAPWLSTAFKRFASLPVTLPFAEIIEGLNTLQPTRISGFPSIIYQLCGAARRGQLRITPKSFLVGAEPLYPEVRLALEEQFKAKVHNFYGCSEASCLAFSCPAGPGLHLSDDLVIVEPVDERGEPVPIGVPSAKVLLTNLFNTLQPLIRYELADSITLLQSQTPCICGSSFRKIDDVQGRSDDSFLYASGVFAHPIIFTEPLCHEPLIQEYQVHQTRAGAHILLRSAEMFDAAALQARIVARLRLLGLKEPEITTQFVERIERNSGGKLRQFVRLVPDSI